MSKELKPVPAKVHPVRLPVSCVQCDLRFHVLVTKESLAKYKAGMEARKAFPFLRRSELYKLKFKVCERCSISGS